MLSLSCARSVVTANSRKQREQDCKLRQYRPVFFMFDITLCSGFGWQNGGTMVVAPHVPQGGVLPRTNMPSTFVVTLPRCSMWAGWSTPSGVHIAIELVTGSGPWDNVPHRPSQLNLAFGVQCTSEGVLHPMQSPYPAGFDLGGDKPDLVYPRRVRDVDHLCHVVDQRRRDVVSYWGIECHGSDARNWRLRDWISELRLLETVSSQQAQNRPLIYSRCGREPWWRGDHKRDH